MFDSVFSVIVASVIVIVFATAKEADQFHGLGLFVRAFISTILKPNSFVILQWVVLVLYGITGALFSYCVSLITTSPLAAFAAVAAYGVISFVVSGTNIMLIDRR